MKISQAGVDLIKHFEGFSAKPYLCPGQVVTIGYGSTRNITMETSTITEAQGHDLLMDDLVRFENAVHRLCPVPLTQCQYDALVSFSFNLGSGALQSSTLRRKLMREDYLGAADEFPRWVFAAGRRLTGLVRRREAERTLFILGVKM